MLTASTEPFTADELPVTVPADKAAMRDEIKRLTAGAAVTVCQPGKPPKQFTAWKPGKPANDNEPQSWPLAEALRRAGRHDDIELCDIYRGLWSIMAADPLQGRDPNMSEGEKEVETENRGSLDDETGEISYKGVRQTDRSPGTVTKATRKGDSDSGERYRPTVSRFNERTLIAQIDSRAIWHRLRAALGPLLAAFEDACLDSATLTEIGETRGFSDKQASAAGRALVFEAIGALSAEWSAIRAEESALERQAEANVIRWRGRWYAARAAFLGRAA